MDYPQDKIIKWQVLFFLWVKTFFVLIIAIPVVMYVFIFSELASPISLRSIAFFANSSQSIHHQLILKNTSSALRLALYRGEYETDLVFLFEKISFYKR